MAKSLKTILLLLILLAVGLRLRALFENTLHADEALFAGWARLIAVWRDPMLKTVAVDKPPLLFYLQALFYPLMGTAEAWPARMPNLIAGILTIPLTARLAHSLFRNMSTTLFAATIVTLSPLAIQFSATGFTDPLLTFWLLAALTTTAEVQRHPNAENRYAVLAGFFFGLALVTKYQALLFLPLCLGVGWLFSWRRGLWLRWAAGLMFVLSLFATWELSRDGGFALVAGQWDSYGGLRLAWSWELWSRLSSWVDLLAALFGPPPLAALFFLILPVSLLLLAVRKHDEYAAIEQLLTLFLLTYLTLHWLLAVPVWDRYLLPIVPVVAIVAARLLQRAQLFFRLRDWQAVAFGIILFALLAPAGWQARYGLWPVGGRADADQGAAEVAAYLADAPYGTVLYDHWYSWHWRYFFFDKGVYVSWFPYPDELVADLTVFAGDQHLRYLVLPHSDAAKPIVRAVDSAGYQLDTAYEASGMTLYRVTRLESR